jgi:hypothetical protein
MKLSAGDLPGSSDGIRTIATDAQLVRYFERESVWSKVKRPGFHGGSCL